MSNYTPITTFHTKDTLTSGDPQKIILGSDVDAELNAISTAIASKYDTSTTSISLTSLTVTSAVTFTGATITGGAYTGITTLSMTGALTYGGVTLTAAVTGTGKMVLDTAPTISGTLTATTFSGSGASLTSLNGTNISSGTVADARLSSNVPLKNAANTFSASQTYTFTGATNVLTFNQNSGADISFIGGTTGRMYLGTQTASAIDIYVGNALKMTIDSSGNYDFKGGTVTTNNGSASEPGFKGVPVSGDPPSNTFSLASCGAFHNLTTNTTIPANSSVAFPVGTVITAHNNTGGTITIAITTDTMIFAGVGTTGTRTLASHAVATLVKTASTVWMIMGSGVS